MAALMCALLGCSGDDDAADPSPPSIETTAAPTTEIATTEPPASTAPPTTSSTTTTTTEPPTTTTLTDEQLKQQIAVELVRAYDNLEQLTAEPTVDGLDERLATIVAPGTDAAADIRALIEELVANGERVVTGVPDYSSVAVESVELVGAAPYGEAVVTFCRVNNRVRVDTQGAPQPGTGGLIASRVHQTVQQTPGGWVPSSAVTEIVSEIGATTCPAA